MSRPMLTNKECLELAVTHSLVFDDVRNAFPYPPTIRYRIMSCCPFCRAEVMADTENTRFYSCGVKVNLKGHPNYVKP